jgi:exodeoxyribonuclease VII large subunit
MNLSSRRRIFTVTEITHDVKCLLEGTFSGIWVEGEVSNFILASSGHIYFVLKDKGAQIKCAFFRNKARSLRFKIGDGQQVVVSGSLSVYEPRGEYQLYVDSIEPKGIGELQLAYEQLKAKLEAEGLFDPAHKKALPILPRKIGIVTSPTGAVIQDMLRILGRRHHNMQILLYPCKVQGEGAAGEIAAGIRYLNALPALDVMIIGRGGGSIEDLWPFNEEIVARAIYHSNIPVISAVGHETDFTIADFVADLRAPTPSAAAEMVVTQKSEFVEKLKNLEKQFTRGLQFYLSQLRNGVLELSAEKVLGTLLGRIRLQQQRADELEFRLRNSQSRQLGEARARGQLLDRQLERFDPIRLLETQKKTMDHITEQLMASLRLRLQILRARLQLLSGQLGALGPQAVLERGYAICRDARGKVVKNARDLSVGDLIQVSLARGKIEGRTEKIYPPEL